MSGRLFAVIPAAGRSRRMGRPKLLLPLGGQTVLDHLLSALARAGIAPAIVVLHPEDRELRAIVERWGAQACVPEIPPPDMRSSVQRALDWLDLHCCPDSDDAWLLSPADHPVLSAETIARIAAHWNEVRPAILVPTSSGRRGHPTIFRWDLAEEVRRLPPDAGINRLLSERSNAVAEFEVGDPSILLDLDTPEDYEALRRQCSE